MDAQRRNGQPRNLRDAFGNDAAMTFGVVAFKAHEADTPYPHQLRCNVHVAQSRFGFHVSAKDCLKQSVISRTRRLAAYFRVAEPTQVNIIDAGSSKCL